LPIALESAEPRLRMAIRVATRLGTERAQEAKPGTGVESVAVRVRKAVW